MLINWRGVGVVLGAIALVIALVVMNLCCGARVEERSTIARVKGEIAAGRSEMRKLQADELARLACDMRVMAKRYLEKGDKVKAQRARGAAQELDRKIKELSER